uniref:Uncharacterized protein n=1 Tax=Romanomermis culicivorax TaxID=13658 RepID=A0A915JXI3_ROMCU
MNGAPVGTNDCDPDPRKIASSDLDPKNCNRSIRIQNSRSCWIRTVSNRSINIRAIWLKLCSFYVRYFIYRRQETALKKLHPLKDMEIHNSVMALENSTQED